MKASLLILFALTACAGETEFFTSNLGSSPYEWIQVKPRVITWEQHVAKYLIVTNGDAVSYITNGYYRTYTMITVPDFKSHILHGLMVRSNEVLVFSETNLVLKVKAK